MSKINKEKVLKIAKKIMKNALNNADESVEAYYNDIELESEDSTTAPEIDEDEVEAVYTEVGKIVKKLIKLI